MYRKKQQGFSIVSAIFLIVIMALLAVGMTRILSTGTQSVSQENTSLKAYLAARSGLEWGMYQAVYGAPVSPTFNFNNSGLQNTSVTLTMNNNPVLGENYFTIRATGMYNTASPEAAQRILELKFTP